MDCVSCDICVHLCFVFVFFPGVFLSSRMTGACSVTTDLIMQVNVRTTTTYMCIVYLFLVHVVYDPRARLYEASARTQHGHCLRGMSRGGRTTLL